MTQQIKMIVSVAPAADHQYTFALTYGNEIWWISSKLDDFGTWHRLVLFDQIIDTDTNIRMIAVDAYAGDDPNCIALMALLSDDRVFRFIFDLDHPGEWRELSKFPPKSSSSYQT